MFNRFCLLALAAFVLTVFALAAFVFLNERAAPTPPTKTPQTQVDEAEKTPQTQADEPEETPRAQVDEAEKTPQTQADEPEETPRAQADEPEKTPQTQVDEAEETPQTRSTAHNFAALRRRQEKAERYAAQKDFAAAVREADYVASQIRIFELHRAASRDAAQKYASLLEAALATLEECSRQAETHDDVSPSEPLSLYF